MCGEVFVPRNGIYPHSVFSWNLGALNQNVRQLFPKIRGIFFNKIVFRVIQTQPGALPCIGIVFISTPGTGKIDVHVVSALNGQNDILIEVSPGTPNGFQSNIDLFLQIFICLFQDLLVIGDIAAMQIPCQCNRPGGILVPGFCLTGLFIFRFFALCLFRGVGSDIFVCNVFVFCAAAGKSSH